MTSAIQTGIQDLYFGLVCRWLLVRTPTTASLLRIAMSRNPGTLGQELNCHGLSSRGAHG
jgi:hypothetical protein